MSCARPITWLRSMNPSTAGVLPAGMSRDGTSRALTVKK